MTKRNSMVVDNARVLHSKKNITACVRHTIFIFFRVDKIVFNHIMI